MPAITQTGTPIAIPLTATHVSPSSSNIPSTLTSAEEAHKTLVIVGLMLIVLIVLVEIAGAGKQAGTSVLIGMGALLLIAGMTQASKFKSWVDSIYPSS